MANQTASDPDLAAAFRAARGICRQHAKSFYFASFFLPNHKRNAAYAVYAFCRMIDDAIDRADMKAPRGGLPHHRSRRRARGAPANGRVEHGGLRGRLR